MDDLGRPEAVHVDAGVVGLDLAEHLLVPLDVEVGVHAALEQDRGALEVDGLGDLLGELLAGEHVGVGVVGASGRRRRTGSPRRTRWCS